MNTRQITGIVIHCSGTPNGQWHSVQEIDQWHQAQGFERTEAFRQRFNSTLHSIGYHFVIYPNGGIAAGRHLDEVGQHTKNHNTKTIAICLIGTDKFTPQQWDALRDNVSLLTREKYYPAARIVGGDQIEIIGRRDNPGFAVTAWLESGMKPPANHIFKGSEA